MRRQRAILPIPDLETLAGVCLAWFLQRLSELRYQSYANVMEATRSCKARVQCIGRRCTLWSIHADCRCDACSMQYSSILPCRILSNSSLAAYQLGLRAYCRCDACNMHPVSSV